ncbi:hypothetical protein M0R45_031116 [Rubus argutus]|uniref:Uncharacterized protein n=1 Tax=Rubus argutus TaxID=59490 RepID=A0AAW1WFF0_RUBAR
MVGHGGGEDAAPSKWTREGDVGDREREAAPSKWTREGDVGDGEREKRRPGLELLTASAREHGGWARRQGL